MVCDEVSSDAATMSRADPGGQAEKPDNSLGLKAPPLTIVPPTNNTTAVTGGMQRGTYLLTHAPNYLLNR